MASVELVRARIDADLKRDATAALADMGLTISDAIRLMLVRVASEKALPFDVRTPNATTRAALDACLLYTSPSPRDRTRSRMPSSA